MEVVIKVIPHSDQRYNTVGDYETDESGRTEIRVSALGNSAMENLIAVHELIEISLCKKAGITDQMIDDFDFAFAKDRAIDDASEPGDDPSAPYYHQHQFATRIEKMTCEQLGIDWDEYEGRIAEIMATYPSSK